MKNLRVLAKFTTLFLVFALLFTACGGEKDSSKLRVGMECAYAPFNWTQLDDSNGAIKMEDGTYANGYDVQIAKLIAEDLGKELVIVKTQWDGLPPSVTSGKIDIIVAGMSATEERKKTLDFTDSYYTSDLVIVVKKDSKYAGATSIKDFAGAVITGQQSTLHYDVIDQIDGVEKDSPLPDFPTMIAALTSGKIDGYVSERPGALSAVFSNPELTFVAFDEGNGFDYAQGEVTISIGLKKGSPLTEDINKALAKISEEKRQKLMEEAVQNQTNGE